MEYLDFELPIKELEDQLDKCMVIGEESDVDVSTTCKQIQKKLEETKKDIYKKKASNRMLSFQSKYDQLFTKNILKGTL